MAIQLHRSFAVHPCPWLGVEIVEPAGLSVTALADALKVSRQTASTVLNDNAGVSAEMAIRFESAFGIKADTLSGCRLAYDLAETRSHEKSIKADRLEPACA